MTVLNFNAQNGCPIHLCAHELVILNNKQNNESSLKNTQSNKTLLCRLIVVNNCVDFLLCHNK